MNCLVENSKKWEELEVFETLLKVFLKNIYLREASHLS